jgi:hypothetical protein
MVSPVCFAAVELDVTVGLGGHAKLGAWAPVRVVVDNKGEATRGELVIPPQTATDELSDYRVSVDVPPQSRRAFMMYARLRVAASALTVEFRPQTGTKVVQHASCALHEPGSRIVLAISRKAGGLGTIGAAPIVSAGPGGPRGYTTADSVVAYVTPDRSTGALGLPDRPAGYEGLATVVLRDISPKDFEDSERDSLVGWVESGGLLVVMAGPNVAELRDSFIEKLSPVSIRGQRVLPHLGALAEYFRQNLNYGRALVADTEAKRGATVIVTQDGVPLLASRPWQTGMVYFCAADCTAPPLNSADLLLTEMWSDILQHQHPVDEWAPLMRLRPKEESAPGGGLSPGIVQLPVLRWEAFALFGGYLLVYIAVLVAVNVLAKRLDRREWTGHATLLGIMVFSLGALYLGSSARLASCRTYDAGVAALRSGASVAWLEGVSGLRSPAARTYNLTAGTPEETLEYLWGAHRELSWPVQEQPTFGVRALPTDLWGFAALRVQGPWRAGGPITTRMLTVNDRPAVSIENGTPYDLRWPFVLLPGGLVTMEGLIPAGSTRETNPFEHSLLQRAQPSPVSPRADDSLFQKLAEHCKAEDSRKAPSVEARIRHRLLQQLGATEGDYRQASRSSMWYPTMPPMPGTPGQPEPFAPQHPIFGAWIDLPQPLLGVSPAREVHVSQILVMVEVPEEGLRPPGGVLRFGDILPTVDSGASGIRPAEEGKLWVSNGAYELRFQLPPESASQTLAALTLTTGTDAADLRADVYNYRLRRWQGIGVAQGTRTATGLYPPSDYVRWPWVRVRVRRRGSEPRTVYCELSGVYGR